MKGKNQRDLKEENTSTVLKLVKDNPGISRISVVRKTDLTPPTVSRIIGFLLEQGVVSETPGESSKVGRKPYYLKFNGNNFRVFAVEMSYTQVKFALIDFDGKIYHVETIETSTDISNKELLELIVKHYKKFADKFGRIFAVGISAPGRVDPKEGKIISIPNLKNLSNFSVYEVAKVVDKPVFVMNDANAEALAEMFFGYGRDVNDFLLVHIGFGIGGGIVLNRKLYNGNFGVSGEIGHISVDMDFGIECDCGNKGCIELYSSANAMLKAVQKQLKAENLTLDKLYELLKKKDKIALSIIQERSRMVGNVLVSVADILAPQRIIIAGPVVKISDFIIPQIKETLKKRSFYGFGENIEVVSSALKENTGLIGAMSVVLNEFLEHPYEFIAQK
ncbi:ROK family transcriptional regulator [Caldisericum exile]|uniref:NagC family transcriptional regulator n=1 Tax=Caldisericum exile (strain DSM 21853 / NBRC 104410 / AZM16c01) TaxID=511051 RepID=A0A7U6GEE6_CALEA|nr:ROK family transcriptional regulator [Caldisericum exile]BAL80865.1 NagC family transcriptional regulator [Caldisericum exile AZM16c01]